MTKKFLLVASDADSLINFRGPLLNALMKAGLEVHAAAPSIYASKSRSKLESMGVNIHEVKMKRTGKNPLTDTKTIYDLWKLMNKIKPNYYLGYTHKPVIYGLFAAWLAGVPFRYALITGLGFTFQSNIFWLNLIVRFLYRMALKNTHKVFFQNPDDENLFLDQRIINYDDKKTFVVNGSGVNLKDFHFTPIPKNINFLLIARLLKDKGVQEYFEAAHIVKKKYPEARFGVVGWIDDNPSAINQEELDYQIKRGSIEFYGRLDDVKPAIANCSVYVLPSYREGTPRTVLEAMAMGRPIITTDAPGCRETVEDGKNGFLIPVKSVDKLADCMMKFIDKPELITLMGTKSRSIAETKYDVNLINKSMMQEMDL